MLLTFVVVIVVIKVWLPREPPMCGHWLFPNQQCEGARGELEVPVRVLLRLLGAPLPDVLNIECVEVRRCSGLPSTLKLLRNESNCGMEAGIAIPRNRKDLLYTLLYSVVSGSRDN